MDRQTPRDAAAVIVVYDGRLLWARRNPEIRFLGGFHAFPGGKTDEGDHRIEVANCGNPELGPLLACAVREVFEEVGLLLVRGGDKLTKGQRASLHDDLVSGRSTFSEILDDWGLRIDAEDFRYTGLWTTPNFSPVRFKTRFFIAECPPKQTPYPAITELENIEFIAPHEALERWRLSEVLISPPVLIALRALAGFESDGTDLNHRAEAMLTYSDACAGEIGHIELNSRLVCMPLRTKTLPPATHTNCFIAGAREFVVIDAASHEPDEQAKILEYVSRMIESGAQCRAIIVSHLHRDHFGGETELKRALAERFAIDVPIAAHPITADDLREYVAVERFIDDNERIGLRDADGSAFDLTALHTPGHARGHLAFYDAERGFLLTSDNVISTGSVVIAHPEGNVTDYLASLARMRDLPGLRFLAGSHGAAVFDARERIQSFIDHRLEREALIADAIDAGADSAEEIVAAVYKGLDERLVPLAVKTVNAHLVRLRNAETRTK